MPHESLDKLEPSSCNDYDKLYETEKSKKQENNQWMPTLFTGLGAFILWFAVLIVIIWIILFSLRPAWVMSSTNPQQVDTGAVLLGAIVIALIIILIIWIIKLIVTGCC